MASRTIAYRLYIDWDFDGSYTDESAYLESARGDMRLAAPESAITAGGGIVSSMTLTLRNPDGRFSPLRTDGALYAYLQNGGGYHAPCYLEVSIDGGSNYYRVFTGVLKLPSETTLSTKENPKVVIEARSREEIYLQKRASTAQADFAAAHDGGYTEADYIYEWLVDVAGVAAGDVTMDSGIFSIPWAWLDDESPIEDAWSLAAACGGRLYADPDGEFRFENLAHWQTAARSLTSQATFTRDEIGGTVALRYDDSELFNIITVEAAPRAAGGIDVLWEPDDVPVIAPQSTKVMTARFDAPAYAISGLEFEAYDDGGNGQTANVTVTPTYYAQSASLSIANGSDMRVHLYPLRIVGQPIVGGPEIEESRNAADDGTNGAFFADRGDRTRAVRGNPYIQSAAQAGTLAQFLLDRHEDPRLTITLRDAQGQPALRLSDRITVTDAATMSSSQACYVLAINWSLDKSFRQTIEAVQAASMYPNDGNYFVLGTHDFTSNRYVFY
mgnify:CR=1 FL=1